MNKAKELDRLDKKIARTKELQKELDHRKEVEDKVFALFAEGKFEEGKALLGTLDDEKVMWQQRKRKKQEIIQKI